MKENLSQPFGWAPLLQAYIQHNIKYIEMVQWRSLSYGITLLSLLLVFFLLKSPIHAPLLTFFSSLFLFSLALPASIYCYFSTRYHERKKNELAYFFFNHGMRVEENALVTNVARPEVIVVAK